MKAIGENEDRRTRFTLHPCKVPSGYFRLSAGYLMKPDALGLGLVVMDLKSLILLGSRWCLVYMIILVAIQ